MDGNVTTVRKGVAGDAGLLAEMGAETFYDSYAADIPAEEMKTYLAEAFGIEQQEAELAQDGSCFLIAEVQGEAVGYARLLGGEAPEEVGSGRVIELQRIYVRKRWIGKGVGSALIAACLEQARSGGYERLWLGVWEKNDRAIAFYRKRGFAEAGAQFFHVGSERHRDVLMCRAVQGGETNDRA